MKGYVICENTMGGTWLQNCEVTGGWWIHENVIKTARKIFQEKLWAIASATMRADGEFAMFLYHEDGGKIVAIEKFDCTQVLNEPYGYDEIIPTEVGPVQEGYQARD